MEYEDRLLRTMFPRSFYHKLNHEEGSIYAYLKDAMSGFPPGLQVLDAGAGEAPYAELFADHHYTAVDFAEGEGKWDYSKLDVVSDLHSLPFADGSFDIVICTQVLEHLREPWLALAELHRLLKPGGAIIGTAPLAFGEHQVPHDYFRYTRYGLRGLLEAAGFNVKEIEPRGGYFKYISMMLIILYQQLFVIIEPRWLKMILFPLRIISFPFFFVLFPLLGGLMDKLDKQRAYTLGYGFFANKI